MKFRYDFVFQYDFEISGLCGGWLPVGSSEGPWQPSSRLLVMTKSSVDSEGLLEICHRANKHLLDLSDRKHSHGRATAVDET